MKPRLYLLLAALGLFSGCVTGPNTKFTELEYHEGKATVYFYRISKLVGCGTYPNIYINGEKKDALVNGSFLSYYLPPGKYDFKADGNILVYPFKKSEIELEIEQQKEYYIRFETDIGDVNVIGDIMTSSWNNNLFVMDKAVAKTEITDLSRNNRDPN
jgi:hypothetical protein